MKINNISIDELTNTVIKGGFCIGCGTCTIFDDSPFDIEWDKYGGLHAVKNVGGTTDIPNICPFSENEINEDAIGSFFYNYEHTKVNNKLGNYLECFAGHVEEEKFRELGSSGGIGKWLGYKLLITNEIDYFIQVFPNDTNNSDDNLFNYRVISNVAELEKGSKSSYYPNTLKDVFAYIKRVEGRYAITGVPCFIKSIKLLMLADELFHSRIIYTIGLFCGAMKSANQAKIIGMQMGVKPENLVKIDFRRKPINKPAHAKVTQVWSNINEKELFIDTGKLFGTDYGAGFFTLKPCDYCDDLVSETADISIGDAWLPKYINDPEGKSLIVVRNLKLLHLINNASKAGDIKIDTVTANEVINSQAGSFRHRRDGLSFRLNESKKKGYWIPNKRVEPTQNHLSPERKIIYGLRAKLAKQSHKIGCLALQKQSFNYFKSSMSPLYNNYLKLTRGSKIKRLSIKLIAKTKFYLNKVGI